MKLGELCEVLNLSVTVKYKDKGEELNSFHLNGKSFQQMIHQCGEHASWDIVAICREHGNCNFIEVEIVKPESDDE